MVDAGVWSHQRTLVAPEVVQDDIGWSKKKKDIGCDQQTKDKLLKSLKDSAHPIRAGAGSATRSATGSATTTRPLGNSKGDEKTEN